MGTRQADGVLLVDKPAGVTSHDVVAVARRALGVRRIGHAGTLDPFATGLLVLLVGRATRLLPYVEGEPKVYEATVRFGAETTTDDATGDVTVRAPLPTRDAVEQGMTALTGALDQLPPAFSAKKVGGRRAYDAARRGEAIALAPARVRVERWELRAWRSGEGETGDAGGEIDVTITCGAGTYIRALARDLGRLAGSAAHLSALRRVRCGPFTVSDAAPLDAVRAGRATLRPVLDAMPSLAVERIDEPALERVARGQDVPATALGPRAALVDPAGALVAIGERHGERWQPRVVLRDA
jgi:tRNA pseudouridine55 synthase